MAHRKAEKKEKNLRDSNPQYLGTKLYDGERAQAGSIIIRQRGTTILAGKNVRTGKDHTLFSVATGTVKFDSKRQLKFNGATLRKKVVHVIPDEA